MLRQLRIALRYGLIHGISDVAIAEVSGRTGAQLADVQSFAKIHLEQRALAISKGNHILRLRGGLGYWSRSQRGGSISGARHQRVVAWGKVGVIDLVGTVVAMQRGVILQDLHAATVAVHVAEGADVHKD